MKFDRVLIFKVKGTDAKTQNSSLFLCFVLETPKLQPFDDQFSFYLIFGVTGSRERWIQ